MFLILKEMFRVAAGTRSLSGETSTVDETLIRHSLMEQFTDPRHIASRRLASRKRVFYACAAARGNSLAIRTLSMRFIRGVMATARRRGRRQTVRYMVAGCHPRPRKTFSNVNA